MWLNGEKLVNFLGKFIGNSNMALPLRERDWVEHGISLKVASLKSKRKQENMLSFVENINFVSSVICPNSKVVS
jgi:hypothetical protein